MAWLFDEATLEMQSKIYSLNMKFSFTNNNKTNEPLCPQYFDHLTVNTRCNTEVALMETITGHRKQIGLKQNDYNLHCTSKNVLTPA